MRKMKLDIDSLAVESFSIGAAAGAGTVRARADFAPYADDGDIAAPVPVTAAQSCPGTCQITCPASCDTCYVTCVTQCSCRTQPCDTCA